MKRTILDGNKKAKWGMIAALAMVGSFALGAWASPNVTINSVTQRWPWNNKVDITYTVTDGQELAASGFYRLVFTATIGGNEYTIDGTNDVHASASSGQHTVTWTLPDGIGAADCSMVARLYTSDTPSGDDYMIIDLTTGVVTYEGLLASQAASNARYNTPTYKTTKLVLRKIPCTAQSTSLPNGPFASGYPTGDDVNYAATNGRTNWITRFDYYMAIFPVTQGQLTTVMGSNNYSTFTTDDGDDLAIYRPVNNIAHSTTRGSNDPSVTPAPSDTSGKSFLERLNGRTQNGCGLTGFDLPTELMFEIAQRAGNVSTYAYNNYVGTSADGGYTDAKTYVVYGGQSHTFAVGSKSANPWGLYDTSGNTYEWCLDDDSRANLKDAPDPWTAAYSGSATKYSLRGGAAYSQYANAAPFRASYRHTDANQAWIAYGFRIAYIVR